MPKNLNSDITKLITKYLSIREHSKLELQNKLSQKGHDLSDIKECINELHHAWKLTMVFLMYSDRYY